MTGRVVWMAVLLATALGCAPSPKETTQMQDLAEQYVKLVLAVGQHDPDYVDAFYGPKAWRDATVKRPLAEWPAPEGIHCGPMWVFRIGNSGAYRGQHRSWLRRLHALNAGGFDAKIRFEKEPTDG